MAQSKQKDYKKMRSKGQDIAPAPHIPSSKLKPKHMALILIGVLFLLVSLLYFPVAFGGKTPVASDTTQWQGAAKAIIDYNQEHSDPALWTPNMFGGMPSYMISFPTRYPFLESLTKLTDKVINWRIFLLLVGGLGIFVLLRHMKLDYRICFLGSLAFMFSCHWLGLLDIGHNTKFRAIMYIPWVIWAMFRLHDKRDLLSLGLMATFLITQLRENHPQISYYLYLFVGMYWIYSLVEAIRLKEIKAHVVFTGLLILAFAFTVLAVLNPYLSTMEYSHYTMRGGGVGQGLDKAYAQAWSFHPLEILGFIVPDFFGGINQSYWGYMPFTQIYNYFGIIVLALGVFALFGKHRRMAIFLWISSAIFTIMSFGEFAPFISDLLLKYLPYFNKFRVPSMILTMTQVIAVILAALGVDSIIDRASAKDSKAFSDKLFKVFWISGAIFVAWLLLARSVFAGLPFVNDATLAQLQQQNMDRLPPQMVAVRLGLLYKSGALSLMLLTVSLGLIYLYSVKKLKNGVFVLILAGLVFVDLFIYTGRHLKDVHPISEHQNRFETKDYDSFLLQDKDNYRIYPFNMNQHRPSGEWAYYHQTIDGYSAAKLKRYDDVLKLINGDPTLQTQGELVRHLLGLYEEGGKDYPTPVLDMLSTKYVIYPDSLPMSQYFTKFVPVFAGAGRVHVYRNTGALPRAWFVSEQRLIPSADSLLAIMRSGAFVPARTALIESSEALVASDSLATGTVEQTAFGMQEAEYKLSLDGEGFLVLSEIYYPAGWKAYLDGEEIPIYPVNYILRGLKIPSGNHELKLVFAPDSYSQSLVGSAAGILLALLALAGGLALDKRRSQASKKINVDTIQD